MPENILYHLLVEVPDILGWKRVITGKIREIFIPQDTAGLSSVEKLLLVIADRISAFDFVLDTPIPGKGAVPTRMSHWWFSQLCGVIDARYLDKNTPTAVAGHAVITRRLGMYLVECVARRYLTGSAHAEYEDIGMVCRIPLPSGLQEASRLSEAIFTPVIEVPQGEYDEDASADRIVQLHGRAMTKSLTGLTLLVYHKAAETTAEHGAIPVDTKSRFRALPGRRAYGDGLKGAARAFILADEVITPDSSRFWPADQWMEGQPTPSFGKQFMRDWLKSPTPGWNRHSNTRPPTLPAGIVEKTTDRCLEAFQILTGKLLV